MGEFDRQPDTAAGGIGALADFVVGKAKEKHDTALANKNALRDWKAKILTESINGGFPGAKDEAERQQMRKQALDDLAALYPTPEAKGLLQQLGDVFHHITNVGQMKKAADSGAQQPLALPASLNGPAPSGGGGSPSASAANPGTPGYSSSPSTTPTANAAIPSKMQLPGTNGGGGDPGADSANPTKAAPVTTASAGAGPSPSPAPAPSAAADTSIPTGPATGPTAPVLSTALKPKAYTLADLAGAAYLSPEAREKIAEHLTDMQEANNLRRKGEAADGVIKTLKASGAWTPQIEAELRAKAAGFDLPGTMMRPVTGKELIPVIESGKLIGFKNPLSNETYTKKEDMPENTRDKWDEVAGTLDTAQKEKDDREQKKQDNINARQNKTIQAMFDRQTRQFQEATAEGDHKKAKAILDKAKVTVTDSQNILSSMQQSYDLALKGDQQAMVNLLANHIAMTTGKAKMRPTKALWEEAAQSDSAMRRIEAHFDSDGYLTGVVLSPEEMKRMVGLGRNAVKNARAQYNSLEQGFQGDIDAPGAVLSTPSTGKGGKGGKSTTPAPAPAVPRMLRSPFIPGSGSSNTSAPPPAASGGKSAADIYLENNGIK